MKVVGAIFEKMKILKFFLYELPLILRVGRKRKERAGDNCKGTLDIECEWDWSVGLDATLGDEQKTKNNFLVSGIFSGKADSVILLGFECTINTQNLNKIVTAIFEKIKILNFFLMRTTLNFGGREKTKKRLEIFVRGL